MLLYNYYMLYKRHCFVFICKIIKNLHMNNKVNFFSTLQKNYYNKHPIRQVQHTHDRTCC